MKKSLQRIVMLLAILWFSNFLLAQEFARVIDESFENGIPASWIQEKVSGDIDWVVEGGDLQDPAHAFDGEKRVAFRNVSNTTTRAKTRLILPVLDLSRLYQPIIVFAHAQDKWAGDFDTLNILYRTSQEKDWVVLKTYDKYISKYQLDTLQLVGFSKTYQVAFEAIDNLGKGVVLDKVEIRSSPNCLNPYDVQVDNITKNSAELSWLGSFDALSFFIKLSTKELTTTQLENENFKADVLNIELSDVWDYKFENLNPDTEYYCYIKSNCGDESSDYTLITFKTLNILSIPYIEDFNVSYTANGVSRLDSWYGSSSSEDVAIPYINSGLTSGKSQYSPDGTYVLCFNHYERQDLSSSLLANEYSYCALPYLDIDDISRLEVSFWTIRQNPTLSTLFSIIVGVMDDQKDIATFVPVDTVSITSMCTFEECIVSLESYKGQGKYIAFLSKFDVLNMFLLDNLKVDYRPAISKVGFTLGAPTANSLKFDFDKNYDAYEVVVSSKKILVNSDLDTLTSVVRKEILDGEVIDGLQESSEYFVYARAIEGTEKGDWSNPQVVRLPGKSQTYPYHLSFEINKLDNSSFYSPSIGEFTMGAKGGIELGTFSFLVNDVTFLTNRKNLPICEQSSKMDNSWCLKMAPETGWLISVFSELAKKETNVSFWAMNIAKKHTKSSFTIGLLSDALDYSTFTPIQTIFVDSKPQFFVFDLDDYDAEGSFFAIKVEESSACYFTDMKYKNVVSCSSVTNLRSITSASDPTKVNIIWDNNGASSWNVRVSKTKYDVDSMAINESVYSYVYDKNVTTNSVSLSDLDYPNKRYYFTIQSVCGDSVGDWVPMDFFDTECLDKEPLPFIENFENQEYLEGDGKTFPIPCMTTQLLIMSLGESSVKSPCIVGVAGYQQYLTFKNNGFYPPSKYKQYVALPKMAQDISHLELRFSMYATSPGQAVSVGVMSDPLDTTTIEIIEVVRCKVFATWVDQIVTFENYEGSAEHIVLVLDENCTSTTSDILVDNIVVDINSGCSRPDYVRLESLVEGKATLAWKGNSEKYVVVLAKQQLSAIDLENTMESDFIVYRDTIESEKFIHSNLDSNTPYYFYVRGICSGGVLSQWSIVLPFKTPCELSSIESLGVESFEAYGSGNGKYPSCYTVGSLASEASPMDIPHCFTGYCKSGKNSLEFSSTPQTNGAYAITSCLDISDIRLLCMRFWASTGISVYSNQWYAHSITVGVVTDPMDLSTFVPIETFDISSEFQQYEVYFDKYKHDYNGVQGKYVMFLSEFDKKNKVYIDDITFSRVSDCYTNFDVDLVTDTSVTINFITKADSYQLKYSTNECDIDMLNGDKLETLEVNDSSYVLTGLDFNTKYYLYARSVCNGEPGDWTRGVIVRTDCPLKLKLPFFDNFDKNVFTQGGAIPECWYGFYGRVGVQVSTSYPFVTEDVAAKSGKKSVLMKEYTNASSYLVSNEIDVDSLSKCQVSLFLKTDAINSYRAIIVGAVNNLDSISESFVAIDTILVFQRTLMWDKFVVSFENYKGGAKHIAFKTDYEASNGNANHNIYIDNIIIELIPECQRPDLFELVHHSDTSISISFKHDCAIRHEVICGPAGFDIEEGGKLLEFESLPCKIGGLVAESSYDFYVRSYCDETKCSPWTFAGSYSTTSKPITTFPYYCNFEEEEETSYWRFVQKNQVNQWCIGMDDAYVVADREKNGDKAMYISCDGGHTANYVAAPTEIVKTPNSISWAYRAIQLDPGIYNISYDWTCYGEGYYDYVRVGLLPYSYNLVAGSNVVTTFDELNVAYFSSSISSSPQGWIDLTQQVSKYASKASGVDTTLALGGQWKTQLDRVIITPELAGAYKLVFFWVNDETNRTGYYSERSAVIDDISITKEDCVQPFNLNIVAYDYNSVDLEWSTIVDSQNGFNVMLSREEIDVNAEELDSTKIEVFEYCEETKCVLTNLASSVEYFVYVQSVCDNNVVTTWEGPVLFETACSSHPVDTVYSFETEETFTIFTMQDPKNTSYTSKAKIPNCFTVGHDLFDCTTYEGFTKVFRLVDNTEGGFIPTQYSRNKENDKDNALYINYSNVNAGAYIALPLIEGDITKMQLSFWMRPIASNRSDGGSVFSGTVSSYYARQITVGTMSDPEDPESFVAIDTVLYPYSQEIIKEKYREHVANDPNKNDFWVEYIIPLEKAVGKYIAFKGEVYGTAIYNTMYIDDISVTSLACLTPTNIVLEDITSTSVKVNCSHGQNDRFVVEAAKNSQFTDGVIRDTVFSFPCVLKGLEPNTEYNLRISTLCDEEKTSSWSNIALFSSANTLSYDCDFSNVTGILPNDWKRATYSFQQVVIDKEISTFNYVSETNTTTWHVEKPLFDRGMFSTQHMAVFAKSYSHWLISPLVHLPVDQKQHLVFDLSLSDYGYNAPITEMDRLDVDNRFILLISEDAGKTWTRDNSIIWGEDAYCAYNDIPFEGEQYVVDLTKYSGKVIQVAFYVESGSVIGEETVLHLDNVHINSYITSVEETVVCQSEDYEDDIFVIASEQIEVGDNSFEQIKFVKEIGNPDILNQLHLKVKPMLITDVVGRVCEGDVYSGYNFSGLIESGIYKQKHIAKNGCDSVVILNLQVDPILSEMFIDTICYGNSVVWNGVEYDRSGVYTDTLISKLTGCDSIVTFVLQVNDAIRSELFVNICYGDTYEFGSQIVSKSGDYDELYETAEGCDSIVTLHANVLPDYRQTINAVIQEGDVYSENGFVGLAFDGVYTLPLKSADGCDSTLTLNLVVINSDTTYVETEITTNDLPFEYYDVYYDENTEPGVYIDTIYMDLDSCENCVIIHTLTILVADAVNDVRIYNVSLVPNPIKANEVLYVNADFTELESKGLIVSVFNTLGECVYIDKPMMYPIKIEDLDQTGFYIVRILTGDGKTYQGKIIVE